MGGQLGVCSCNMFYCLVQTVLTCADACDRAKGIFDTAIDWLLTGQLCRDDMLIVDHLGTQKHKDNSNHTAVAIHDRWWKDLGFSGLGGFGDLIFFGGA